MLASRGRVSMDDCFGFSRDANSSRIVFHTLPHPHQDLQPCYSQKIPTHIRAPPSLSVAETKQALDLLSTKSIVALVPIEP